MLNFLVQKRFWKRLAITAGLLIVVLLIADFFMVWWTEHRLQAKIVEISAAGDPTSIADLAPEPIPADQNAAAILERVAPQLESFEKERDQWLNSPPGVAFENAEDHGDLPTVQQITAVRQIVDKYAEIDQALSEAAACNHYASQIDYSHESIGLDSTIAMPINNLRIALRYEAWRMLVLTADGRQDAAIKHGIEMLKVVRLFDAEPLIVNSLVALAVRGVAVQSLYDALAAGPVSPESHAALDSELALQDDPRRFVHALKTERAYSLSVALEGRLLSEERDTFPLVWKMFGWPMKMLYIEALDWYDTNLELAARPWHETQGRIGRFDNDSLKTEFGIMADLMLPALEASYDAEARTMATLRALRIFNALTQFRDEHGREASGLDDLSLPKGATIDPFSGEPLKLKHTDDGWVIYSVYINGVDDGGDFKDMKDWGVAPPKYRATE